MAVMLITALRAAETLAAFHRQNSMGEARGRHQDMARLCADDADTIKRTIVADGGTVENQADALRRRDITIAQRIIDRRAILHRLGMAADDVPGAGMAMTWDIADALHGEREGKA
jgi:hypothetical protein